MEDKNTVIPKHIAIVMDGNGRWAKKRFLPRTYGHKKGVDSVRRTIRACNDHGVEYLTLFAFSSENWKRPQDEVSALMSLFMTALENEAKSLADNNIRLSFIGDIKAFPEELQQKICQVEEMTKNGTTLKMQVAANYGGRWDIVNACKQLAAKYKDGEISQSDINEDTLSDLVSTHTIPDPDLFVRTGGEKRISNFLLWQLAYAEFYFTDVLWPDFDGKQLALAIKAFSTRQRRFGKTGDQVISENNSGQEHA